MSTTASELETLNELLKKFRFAMVTTRAEDGALHAHPLTVPVDVENPGEVGQSQQGAIGGAQRGERVSGADDPDALTTVRRALHDIGDLVDRSRFEDTSRGGVDVARPVAPGHPKFCPSPR